MEYIIETENLTKQYGTATVVDNINLYVPKGKIYSLLGRNGAGKTTAMKMILQLAFPTDRMVRLFGTSYKENINTLYRKVGSIIETPGFYGNLTGRENLQILAKLRGKISKSEVEKALEFVGLHKEKRKVFADYSLGMKQRLGIAAAIMHEPELLILDEPINGLDPIGISEIRSYLSELSHNNGIPIPRTKLLLGKFFTLLLWIMMLTFVTWAGIFIVCGLFHAVFTLEGYSLLMAIRWLPEFLLGGLLMFLTSSPFAFTALKTKGFVAPMIGSAVIVMGSAALSNQEWGELYPWTATYFLVQGKIKSIGYPLLLSVAIILLVSAVGFIMTFHHFKKEDLK